MELTDAHQTPRRLSTGELRWLLIAVAAHAVLLFWPVSRHDREPLADNAMPLVLRLVQPTSSPARPAPEPEPAHREAPPPAPASAVDAPAAVTSTVPDEPPEPVEDRGETGAVTNWSAARLLQSIRNGRLEPFSPAVPARPLGGLRGMTETDVPALRRRGNRAAHPGVVDRWLAADGSHNVMVELPGGDLLCGRAESWDPLRPLVEPVMMFRSCGHRPTFTVPPDLRPMMPD